MVAAAIIGTGIATGIATGVAGSSAASATKHASDSSVQVQREALEQQKELSAPYRELGTAALPQYEALLGLNGGDAGTIKAALESTPGYQFTKEEGQKGILNQASLAGGVGGNTIAALDKFNTGLADSTYGEQVGRIGQAVGMGQASAAGQAANTGAAAGNISSTLINQGNNIAGINASTIAGITKAGTNAVDQYQTQQMLAALTKQSGG